MLTTIKKIRKRFTLLQFAETVSVSLPTGFFVWVLMILSNPQLFMHVYYLIILQPIAYLIVELMSYVHCRFKKLKVTSPEKNVTKVTSPEKNVTKIKDEEHKPPVNKQTYYKLRDMTPEEEWAYLYLMYY